MTHGFYLEDVPLAEELGLQWSGPGKDFFAPDRGWRDLGMVEVDEGEGGLVKVEVTAMPAMFWRFTIESQGRTTVLSTGSGTLRDYWPIAEQFAMGMLAIDMALTTSDH